MPMWLRSVLHSFVTLFSRRDRVKLANLSMCFRLSVMEQMRDEDCQAMDASLHLLTQWRDETGKAWEIMSKMANGKYASEAERDQEVSAWIERARRLKELTERMVAGERERRSIC